MEDEWKIDEVNKSFITETCKVNVEIIISKNYGSTAHFPFLQMMRMSQLIEININFQDDEEKENAVLFSDVAMENKFHSRVLFFFLTLCV